MMRRKRTAEGKAKPAFRAGQQDGNLKTLMFSTAIHPDGRLEFSIHDADGYVLGLAQCGAGLIGQQALYARAK
jgi:hypothetical protein